jgi:hypothetical protein
MGRIYDGEGLHVATVAQEIVVREVLPNIRGVVITEVAMQFSWILLAFSSLSFLGLGTTPPTPEWGLMVAGARTYITINALPLLAPMVMPSLSVAPGGTVLRKNNLLVPLPERYVAYTVVAPMVRVSRGVPPLVFTVTLAEKSTAKSISWPDA